jgi:hypothetical protein
VIEIIGWANVKGDSFDLINWDIDVLRPFLPFGSILSFGGNEIGRSWGSFAGNNLWSNGWNHSNTDVFGSSWLICVLLVVLLVMLFVVIG